MSEPCQNFCLILENKLSIASIFMFLFQFVYEIVFFEFLFALYGTNRSSGNCFLCGGCLYYNRQHIREKWLKQCRNYIRSDICIRFVWLVRVLVLAFIVHGKNLLLFWEDEELWTFW